MICLFLQGERSCRTGEIRLTEVGSVEFCSSGRWGQVCDPFWYTSDAEVVCRELGYMAEGRLLR